MGCGSIWIPSGVARTGPAWPEGTRPARRKEHDLVSLETSGFLERLGFDVPDATFDSLYRSPGTVRKAASE